MARSKGRVEAVSFQRHRELSGVEIRKVEDSWRDFRSYSADFEFLIAGTWRGEIECPRRRALIGAESLVCSPPGEVFLGRASRVGSRSSLSVDRDLLTSHLAEHGVSANQVRFRWFTQASKCVRNAALELQRVIHPGSALLELQAAFSDLVAALVAEVLEGAVSSGARGQGADKQAAERVRECLHYDLSSNVDLATVARETGMTRFRALRVFKRWYGLPPHAYRLRVRLGLVQKSLRKGLRPAQAAAEYGFTDQSHLTRHFRRLLGVTPAEYARIGA